MVSGRPCFWVRPSPPPAQRGRLAERKAVLRRTSDGVRWNESTMPDGWDGMVMIAVVSTSKVRGSGVTQVLGIPGLAFVERTDGLQPSPQLERAQGIFRDLRS